MSTSALKKIFSSSFGCTLILLCIYAYLNKHLNGDFWQTMQQSRSALTAEYCELDQVTHFFRQTINTYSNLSYFFLGCIILGIGIFDLKNKNSATKNSIQHFPALSILFGCCLIYLCFGSSFFHASLSWIGQRFDMNATYSIALVSIGICLHRLKGNSNISVQYKAIFIIILLLLMLIFVQLHLLISSSILLPFLFLIIVGITTYHYLKNKHKFNLSYALISFILLIIAYILRIVDVKKTICQPQSIIQLHALWHIFTGLSAFMLYLFYRKEKKTS
ncbi:MAG: ceramidase domain-containing protein [Bacteroidetes bacterium]|nr:ceramidase domain-containing protein [Bacteroidota bacterium]